MASTDKFVVGLDFGTTFSGIAYAFVDSKRLDVVPEIRIIKAYPGSNGVTSEKVPTEIAYDNDVTRWGYLIEDADNVIRCIKLLLDDDQEMPSFISRQEMMAKLNLSGRDAADCARDYLTKLYGYTIDTLNKHYGEAFVKNTKIEFVLTIPAVWSDRAKNATLVAAQTSGIKNLIRTISEPEAAACHALKVIQPNHLKVGAQIVVCDADGGTVDLITYRITQLEPLRLQESVGGTGALCGSVFLNLAFERHVADRIGQDVLDNLKLTNPFAWKTGLKTFEEHIKRNFHDGYTSSFMVAFPGLADCKKAGVRFSSLVLTHDHLQEIFNPVPQQVTQLIQSQVDAVEQRGDSVSAVLLVGGFGQSRILYDRVKKRFQDTSQPFDQLVVMQPTDAWTAVVRGAVSKGLDNPVVTDRISRFNYGCVIDEPFDPETHPEDSMYWNETQEEWYARDVMHWFIKKGSMVAETRAFSQGLMRTWNGGKIPSRAHLIDTTDLWANSSDFAPVMKDDTISRTVCTLKADLTAIPRSFFLHKHTSRGLAYRRLDYTLEMRIHSAQLDFKLNIDSVSYGSVTATYNV